MFSECPMYHDIRNKLFEKLGKNSINFPHLSHLNKLIWAMSNPEPDICKIIAKYVFECFAIRETHMKAITA